jgi:hypothetical protein
MKLGPISFTWEDQDKKNSRWHEFGTKPTLVSTKKTIVCLLLVRSILNIGTIITMIIINNLEHLYWQLIGLGKDQELGVLPHFILVLIVNSLVIIIIIIIILTHLIMQSVLCFSMCLASQKWQIYVVLLVMDQSNKGIPIFK